MKLVTVW